MDIEKRIYDKEELIKRVSLFYKEESSNIEQMSNAVISALFTILKEGKSFRYTGEFPLMRTKISKANICENSPRNPRRDYIICTIKMK